MSLWRQDIGSHARGCPHKRRRDECVIPTCPSLVGWPLAKGQAGHPCASCGDISMHEWSPGKHRACSAACLARQAPAGHIVEAVKLRHGVALSVC